MRIEVPVSLGELVDKLSILKIKNEMIKDSFKLEAIKLEEKLLEEKLASLKLDILELLNELTKTNRKLWKIEDDIREKERKSEFDEEFIALARSVYVTNDERFDIKNHINMKFGSELKEVKSYEKY